MSFLSDKWEEAKKQASNPFGQGQLINSPSLGANLLQHGNNDFMGGNMGGLMEGWTFDNAKDWGNKNIPGLAIADEMSPVASAYRASEAGKEKAPDYENYKKFNADEYKGFDSSAINQNMQRDIASGSANRRQQQLAQLNKMGVRGADSTAAMGRIGADQERAAQGIQASLARQQYEDAWRQYLSGHDDWNAGQDRKLQSWQAKQKKAQDAKNSSMQMLGGVASMFI